MSVDLAALPPPDVVERLDYERILAETLADYRARFPQFSAWVESEPAVKLLETVAYREFLLRNRVNEAARSVMLAHAVGADLDNLAALFAVERLAAESDDGLRRRVLLSLGAHNTAGSQAGYEFWARSVAGVGDVCAERSVPGAVRVVVGGEIAGEGAAALDAQPPLALYRAVAAVFERDDVRPLTDTVAVEALRVRPFRVDATLTLAAAADPATIVAAAAAACRAYCASRHRCGADNTVHRSALINSLFVPGVAAVDLTAPAADVDPASNEAPWPTAQTAAPYGGGVPAADPVRQPMDGVAVAAA